MQALGARGVPVVARGERFVYGQDLRQVAQLLGVACDAGPALPAAALVARAGQLLQVATRLLDLVPADRLHDELPGRARSYLSLGNHVVAIGQALLEVLQGAPFDGARGAAEADPLQSPALLTRAAADLADALPGALPPDVAQRTIATFYGPQDLHSVIERCTWHIAQHTRQLDMVLDIVGVDHPPVATELLRDLPLPMDVWDS